MRNINFMKKGIVEIVFLLYVFTSYIGLLYLDVYNPIVLIGVVLIIFFSIYLVIKKNQPINRFMFIFAIYHLIPCLLMDNLSNIFYMLAYVTLLISISLFISYMKERSMLAICKVVMFTSIFNFIYMLSQPFTITRTKKILGLSINLRMSENVVFSRSAIIALIGFILFYKLKPVNFKQRVVKLAGIFINIFTIVFLGKLSTLLTLFIVIISGEVVKLIRNKRLYKLIAMVITGVTFSLGFFMPTIINICIKYNINYRMIFSGREELWGKYLNHFKEAPIINKLFGGIYIRTMNEVGGEIIKHPHNQYLTILVSVGLIGLVLYMILFYKAYYNALLYRDIQGFMILLSINLIGITDDYIFLTVIIIDSFYYIYYSVLNNRKQAYKDSRNGVNNE